MNPVLCGAALRNKGIQPLLDAVVDFLPSPVDLPPVDGVDPKSGKPALRKCDPEEPLVAYAFKTYSDRHGDLTYLRIYSGTLRLGDQVHNATRGKVERVSRLMEMHAEERRAIEMVSAGDIAAVVGLRYTVTGDTLCPKQAPFVLEELRFAEPVISLAIEPRSSADRDDLEEALQRLARA